MIENSIEDEDLQSLKILTIGESGVGKSSIILRYTENKFSESFLSTIGIDFKSKTNYFDNKKYCLKIWDTAGQERFKTITQQYFKGSDVNLLIFDLTNMNSFKKMQNWIDSITESIGNSTFILVGNKNDLINEKIVNDEIIDEFCSINKIKYISVSAKTGDNITKLFQFVVEEFLNKSFSTNSTSVNISNSNFSESFVKEIKENGKMHFNNKSAITVKKIKINKINKDLNNNKNKKCCKKN